MDDSSEARLVAPATLEIVRRLPAPIERVWQYIIDPELRGQWFCSGETGSKPGDDFVMAFDHSQLSKTPPPDDAGCGEPTTMIGTILVFDPPNTLSYNWPGDHGGDTVVTIRLAEEGANTKLHLSHERLASPPFQRGASAGWHAHIDLLCDLIHQRPTRDFWVHYVALKTKYDQQIPDSISV